MKLRSAISILALVGAAAFTAPADAQPNHHGLASAHDGWHGGGWHGGHGFAASHRFIGHDFAHFSVGDRALWRGGHWWHGHFHGRGGWWWFAGGSWYFYDAPVYPYPGYVSDYYADDDYDDGGNNGGYAWYYCQNPPGYYPYIQNCSTQWQPVPAGSPPAGYGPGPGYQASPQGGPNEGPPPGYNGPNAGPQQGYGNGDEDDQGPPPPNQR